MVTADIPRQAQSLNYASYSSVASNEGSDVAVLLAGLVDFRNKSTAVKSSRSPMIDELSSIYADCQMANWDGNGADPIGIDTINQTKLLLDAIPQGVMAPELAPEPDGRVSLDWLVARNRILSISLGSGSTIPFAYSNGLSRGHGVTEFSQGRFPRDLFELLRLIGAVDGQ